MTQISERLWLGDAFDAHDDDFLRQAKITHIVKCAVEVCHRYPAGIAFTLVDMADDDPESARLIFPAADRVTQLLADGEVVLVHCWAGVSRSASVVTAHIMRHHGLSAHAALRLVQSKRPIVRPYAKFVDHLRQHQANALARGLRRLKQGGLVYMIMGELR